MGDGTNVALAGLVSSAAVQASELQIKVDSSVISQRLVVVEYRNVQRLKTIANVYDDDDTSVAEPDETPVTEPAPEDTLDQNLAIGDASIDELLVDDPTEGTWYFAIRTLDTDGNRSRLSEIVYKQI